MGCCSVFNSFWLWGCLNGTCSEIYINNSSICYTGRSGGGIGDNVKSISEQFPEQNITINSGNPYSTYGYSTYDGRKVNYDGTLGGYMSQKK